MILKLTEEFTNNLADKLMTLLKEEKLNTIKCTSGAKKNAPESCKKGSIIYFLYDDKEIIIYIGETSKSIKRRLYGDGSGAHSKKDWFIKVKKVKYYKNDEMSDESRKTIERALIQKYKPKYNDKITKRIDKY